MKDNKRVKQISLDVVVGSETDGEDLAVQVKKELERRGYTIYGSGFQADLTEEYNIIDKNDDVDIECLIALLKDKVTKEYDVYIEELRHKAIDEVIENSYKTTMFKEFKTCFENYTQLHLENYQIKLLIRTSNILERLYEHWKTYDSDEFEIYKEFVFEFWNWDQLKAETKDSDVLTWDKMYEKYPEKREEMSEKTERDFVNDCFDLYENEGFAEKFWTSDEEYTRYIGMKFKVLQRTPEKRNALSTLPLWDIQLEDGTLLTAYPEEIIPSAIKSHGGTI